MSSFTCTFAAGRTECCNIIASVGLLPSYEKALLPSGHSRADGWNEAIGSIEIVISRPLQLTSDFDDYSHAVLSTLLSVVNHSYTPFSWSVGPWRNTKRSTKELWGFHRMRPRDGCWDPRLLTPRSMPWYTISTPNPRTVWSSVSTGSSVDLSLTTDDRIHPLPC